MVKTKEMAGNVLEPRAVFFLGCGIASHFLNNRMPFRRNPIPPDCRIKVLHLQLGQPVRISISFQSVPL